MEPHDDIRIVVVGDPGVGKTSFVHILCHNEPLRHPAYTIGCSIDVKMHTCFRTGKSYFVEFVDVGGSSQHKSARNMFYKRVNGIVLVHDLSNRKSYYNLWRWMAEVLGSPTFKESEKALGAAGGSMSTSMSSSWGATSSGSLPGGGMAGGGGGGGLSGRDYDFELRIGENWNVPPILVVGTKADLVKQELTGRQRRYSIVDEYNGEYVNVCTLASTHFAQNSIAAEKIDGFFDRVIEKRFGTALENQYHSPQMGAFAATSSITTGLGRDERRRPVHIATNMPTSPGLYGPNPSSPGFPNRAILGSPPGRYEALKDQGSPTKRQSWNVFRKPTTYLDVPAIEEPQQMLRSSSSSSSLRQQSIRQEPGQLRTSNSASSLRQLASGQSQRPNVVRSSSVADVAVHPPGSGGSGRSTTYWSSSGGR